MPVLKQSRLQEKKTQTPPSYQRRAQVCGLNVRALQRLVFLLVGGAVLDVMGLRGVSYWEQALCFMARAQLPVCSLLSAHRKVIKKPPHSKATLDRALSKHKLKETPPPSSLLIRYWSEMRN